MNWQNERWIKLYTRDTGDWLFLSFDAQALFLMLLRKVDRNGRLSLGKRGIEAIPQIVGHVQPEAVTRVTGALAVLIEDGCVVVKGEHLIIPNFEDAQEALTSNAERQRRHKEKVRAGNAVTLPKTRGNEQNRTEQTRTEDLKPMSNSLNSTGAVLELLTPEKQVFAHWQKVMRKHRTVLDSKRERLIKARLEDYSVDQLCRAIDGYLNSPHHMGKNENGTKYNDISLICRDSTHVEQFMPAAPSTGPPPEKRKTEAEIAAEVNREFEAKHGGI